MIRSQLQQPELCHAAAEATKAAAPEATEAATAAPHRMAGTPTHGHERDARGDDGGIREELAGGIRHRNEGDRRQLAVDLTFGNRF
jgi:hypothetical protein